MTITKEQLKDLRTASIVRFIYDGTHSTVSTLTCYNYEENVQDPPPHEFAKMVVGAQGITPPDVRIQWDLPSHSHLPSYHVYSFFHYVLRANMTLRVKIGANLGYVGGPYRDDFYFVIEETGGSHWFRQWVFFMDLVTNTAPQDRYISGPGVSTTYEQTFLF